MPSSPESLSIRLNGKLIAVKPGDTILQAAQQEGSYIPTLCAHPDLTPFGGCRLCVVEVQGRGFRTACTTPVEDGMAVSTSSDRLQAERAEILQLILSEHPSSCLICDEQKECGEFTVTTRKVGVTSGCRTCPNDRQCELQAVVDYVGIKEIKYPVIYRGLPVEKNDPFFDRDYNLCILCGRCVRACQDQRVAGTLAFTQRGRKTVVGPAFGRTHMDAGCEFCGACVSVCPTGALAEKARKWDGKPEREQNTTCLLCGLGCELRVLAKGERILGTLPAVGIPGRNGNEPKEGGQLCVKGRFCVPELLGRHDRLKKPYQFINGNRIPLTWEEAETVAVESLSTCPPDRFGMLISADCTNEDIFIARKFARVVMKYSAVETSGRLGLGRALPALTKWLNRSAGLSAIHRASCILAIGVDARFEQSVVGSEIRKAQRNGAKLITVHPRAHHLARIADEWLQIELSKLDTQHEFLREPLRESSTPVIILGPEVLQGERNSVILDVVDDLLESSNAQMVILPWPSNLAGALMLGTYSDLPVEPKVLYLVGEQIPEQVNPEWAIAQVIYPPTSPRTGDLALPAAAFTEMDGTVITGDRQVRSVHKVVNPPGEALPHWQILCRIATRLGAEGFQFSSSDEIRLEMTEAFPGFAEAGTHRWEIPSASARSASSFDGNLYQGIALADHVKGFAELSTKNKR